MTDQNKEPQERNEGTRSNALTRVMDIIGAYNSIAPEADEILQGGVTDAVIDATERPEHEEFEEYYQKLPEQELETHPERIEHLEEAARRLSHKTGQDFTAAPKIQDGGYTARLMQNQRRLDKAWRAVKNALDTFVKSEEWDRLKAEFPGLEDMDALFIAYMVEDLIEYAPEIKEILQGYREQGRDIDFRGLIYGEPPQDAGPEGFIEYVLNRAQMTRAERQGTDPAQISKRPFAGPLRLNDADFFPLYNANFTNELMRLTARDFVPNKEGTIAYYTDAKGRKYTIDQFNELFGNLDTSTKKILDAALMCLTEQHYFKTDLDNINPTVLLSLIDYGKATNNILTPEVMETKEEQRKENRRVKERKKEMRKQIRKDLEDLEKIEGTEETTEGEKAGEYIKIRIISSHRVINDTIRINFDIDFARFIAGEHHIMQFPTALFRIDNRKPNTYSIGRKLALHNSMDSNYFSGTDCTLSVRTLLSEAPEIPTMQELKDRKQRNWKDKIKRPLEKSLNELIDMYPMLSRWEYRDPKTGTRYTAETAQALTWEEYKRLMIDWTMKAQPPGQEERRARRLKEKEEAQAEALKAGKKKPRKRGRPKKNQ